MFSSIGRAVKKAGAALGAGAKAGAEGGSCGPGNAATQDSMRSGVILTSGKGGTRPPITRPKPIDSGSTSTTQIGYPGSGQCGPSVQPAIYRPPADQGSSEPMWV